MVDDADLPLSGAEIEGGVDVLQGHRRYWRGLEHVAYEAMSLEARLFRGDVEVRRTFVEQRHRRRAWSARRSILLSLAPLGGSVHTVFFVALGERCGCGTICSLAQSICRSSALICEVWSFYPGDSDLRGDCVWAQVECEGALALCRRCGGAAGGE